MELYFLRGLLFGLSIAVPVGPMGVLCIRRTLAAGWATGLLTGLGVATADALYGCIAGFGLTSIANLLIDQALWLRLLGGGFLCYLGIKTLLSQPASEAAAAIEKVTGLYAYGSAVLLTLTNPATILSFLAIFAGLGLVTAAGNYAAAGTLVLGVFLGSALWWLTLSSVTARFRSSLTVKRLRWLNRISGSILLGFGIIALSVWN